MRVLGVVGAFGVLSAAIAVACTSSNSSNASAGDACQSAGGTCVAGGAPCATLAEDGAQDCETNPPNPGGFFCCSSRLGTCAQRTTNAQNDTLQFVSQAQADSSCKVDSDCTIASNSSACWNGCGAVVNQAGATRLAAGIAQVNAIYCETFAADGCEPNPAPPCIGGGAYCVAEQCTELPGPPIEDAGGEASTDGGGD